jgi:hypothetical protein
MNIIKTFPPLATLAAGLLLLAGCSSDQGVSGSDFATNTDTTTTLATSTFPSELITGTGGQAWDGKDPEVIGSQSMLITLDGWSYKNLESLKLTWEDDLGKKGVVSFTAATQENIAALQQLDPEALTLIGSRVISPSSDLSCTSEGCTGTHPYDLAWLTQPELVPTFGTSYAAYGIKNLAYYSTLNLSAGSKNVRIDADGEKAFTLDTSLAGGKDTATLGSAFGMVFPLESSWLTDGDNWRDIGGPIRSTVAQARVSAETNAVTFPSSGLGSPWEKALGLSNSALTFQSSPTTGCGMGVLCIPGKAGASVAQKLVTTAKPLTLCNASGEAAAAVLITGSGEINFEHPTNQYGLNNVNGEPLINISPAGGASYGGLPAQLAQGPVGAEFTVLYVLDLSGYVSDILGEASNSSATLTPFTEPYEFYGEKWKTCS